MRGALPLAIVLSLAAGCGKPVRLGAIVSRSGAAAVYGERVTHGFDLAVDEIDRAGGVRGRPIALLYRDDATNAEVGMSVVRELVERERVPVVLGAVSSPVTLRIASFCDSEHVLLLSPSASAPQISQAGEYVFRTYPSDDLEGASMAEFARDLGLDRVAVLAVDTDYGRSLAGVFEKRFTEAGGTIVGTYPFAEGDAAALRAVVTAIGAAEPRGLYLPAYVADVATALRLLRDAGVHPIVLGTSAITDDLPRLAGAAAENVVVPRPAFDPDGDNPQARAFAAAYLARYGDPPDVYAAHAYDTMKVLAEAAERAGSWHPEELRRALLHIDNFEGTTGRMAFDPNGDVVQYPRLFVIRGGRFVPYDRFVEGGGALPVPQR
jgi:branched-chain amino acid transport system substrate-binding protein